MVNSSCTVAETFGWVSQGKSVARMKELTLQGNDVLKRKTV